MITSTYGARASGTAAVSCTSEQGHARALVGYHTIYEERLVVLWQRIHRFETLYNPAALGDKPRGRVIQYLDAMEVVCFQPLQAMFGCVSYKYTAEA